jgi:hypothetical protein
MNTTQKAAAQIEFKFILPEDEFDRRFPGVARTLYMTYRFGFRNVRNALLERIAETADFGELDDYLEGS